MDALPPIPPMVHCISHCNLRAGLVTSTVFLPYPPPTASKKVVVFLRSRFQSVKFLQIEKTLILSEVYTRHLFKCPWVKLDLVIVVSPKGKGSVLTAMAIAWGEKGLNPPKSWDEAISPRLVSEWISDDLIPQLRRL